MIYRWEKQNQNNQAKYYVVALESDIFGDTVLMCYWGRSHSKLGGSKCVASGEPDYLESLIADIHTRRLQHGYQLIDGQLSTTMDKDMKHGSEKKITRKKSSSRESKESRQGKSNKIRKTKSEVIQKNFDFFESTEEIFCIA